MEPSGLCPVSIRLLEAGKSQTGLGPPPGSPEDSGGDEPEFCGIDEASPMDTVIGDDLHGCCRRHDVPRGRTPMREGGAAERFMVEPVIGSVKTR